MASLFHEVFLVPRLTGGLAHFVDIAELDRVFWAGLFTHAAKAAAQGVDLELDGVLLLVIPFTGLDVDAFRRTNRRAQHACRAVLDAIDGLDVVHSSVPLRVLATFFGILNRHFLLEDLRDRDLQALDGLEKVESLEKTWLVLNDHLQTTL